MEKSAQQALHEQKASVKREEVYRGRVISLRKDSCPSMEGKLKAWDIVVHPGAVVLVPVTKNKELLLVKQWRRASEKILLEFPAGTLEKEEKPALCAQRELQEETGYKAHTIIPLGGFYSAPGFCTEYLHLFLALDLEEAPLATDDDDEAIDLIVASFEQVAHMIERDQIQDAKTIAGFYRYEQWLKNQ
jgi:ADP-ribose pyrophosphatase